MSSDSSKPEADLPTDAFDLVELTLALHRDGSLRRLAQAPGPPTRIDGFTVGARACNGQRPMAVR